MAGQGKEDDEWRKRPDLWLLEAVGEGGGTG